MSQHFVTGIWEDEEIEDLSRYVVWHREHPHCITPRPLKPNEDITENPGADKKMDEGNPQLVYTRQPGQPPPIPKEFFPSTIGKDGDTDEASVVALKTEYDMILFNRFDREDPW